MKKIVALASLMTMFWFVIVAGFWGGVLYLAFRVLKHFGIL
ncbi:hypothetical protein [Paenibacillus hexagrammi]|nr:hypothetical protein [Paenibacillus sp. YPD9-1]